MDCKKPEWVSAIAHWIVALTAIVGTVLVWNELNHLTKQNTLLKQSVDESKKQTESFQDILRESLHPYPVYDTLVFNTGYVNVVKDKFTLVYQKKIINAGPGRLLLLGYIAYVADDQLSFRDNFLSGQLSNIETDKYPQALRRTTLIPGSFQSCGVNVMFLNLSFSKKKYVYDLIFFEDELGNLYDAETSYLITFKDAKIESHGLEAVVDQSLQLATKYSHPYNQIERKKLFNCLEKVNPFLMYSISGYQAK